MKSRTEIVFWSLFAAPVLLVGVIPSVSSTVIYVSSRGYQCRICAIAKSEKKVAFYGIPVLFRESPARANQHTKLYEQHIAERHEHEWCRGAFSIHSRGWFRLGEQGGGGRSIQAHLTEHTLKVAESLRASPVDFRRKVFHAIIGPYAEHDPAPLELMAIIRDDPAVTDPVRAAAFWKSWLEGPGAATTKGRP